LAFCTRYAASAHGRLWHKGMTAIGQSMSALPGHFRLRLARRWQAHHRPRSRELLTTYSLREIAEVGGLMSYGSNFVDARASSISSSTPRPPRCSASQHDPVRPEDVNTCFWLKLRILPCSPCIVSCRGNERCSSARCRSACRCASYAVCRASRRYTARSRKAARIAAH
jgi:hypothetical protein